MVQRALEDFERLKDLWKLKILCLGADEGSECLKGFQDSSEEPFKFFEAFEVKQNFPRTTLSVSKSQKLDNLNSMAFSLCPNNQNTNEHPLGPPF